MNLFAIFQFIILKNVILPFYKIKFQSIRFTTTIK